MSDFNKETLSHLKKLSQIDCTQEEEEEILQSLARILDHVETLKEVDTQGVPPCRFVLQTMLKNQIREDVVAPPLSREEFLANAPDQIGGMIRVPAVIKS